MVCELALHRNYTLMTLGLSKLTMDFSHGSATDDT
jgi:hypothetical protein